MTGLARARQHRHKRSRDVDAELLEEYVKIRTAGEKDDEDIGDNPDEEEKCLRPYCDRMRSFRRYPFDRLMKNKRSC